jgi:hypothetical protein
VGSRGGGGPARKLSSGKEMLGKRSAATSKQGYRVVVERVLRPGVMLQCKQELSTTARCVAAGGGSERSWRVRGRAVGEGNRAGTGRGRRVEVIPAGGGVAAVAERRLEVKDCAGGKGW